MERGNHKLRVLVASDYPKVRDLLIALAKEEPEVVVVGQADNGTRGITLARSLRPDIALLDCHLPHTLGIDSLPLSRIGGLDAAIAITEEVKSTKVVVLVNLDNITVQEEGAALVGEVSFCREVEKSIIAFTLRQVRQESPAPAGVIFANLEQCKKKSFRQRFTEICEAAIVYGCLG